MGKLRIEPKVKPPVEEKEYNYYKGVLLEARKVADENHVFYDLEKNESLSKVRKALGYVAEQEGLKLAVRAKRGAHSISLRFDTGSPGGLSSRISAKESRRRILSALNKAQRPLQKSEIIAATGVSTSSWNVRIKELLEEGHVQRHGSGRQTRYSAG